MKSKIKLKLLSVGLSMLLFAAPGYANFSIPDQELPSVKSLKRDENRALKPGDSIKVTVYPPDPYITGGQMLISSEGNITLALVGKVYIEGLTLIEAERKLVEIIDADYIIEPEVVIELESERKLQMSVSVLGAVKSPGAFEVESDTEVTLIRAILKAGGFSDVANIKKIKIVRKTTGGETDVIRVNAERIVTGDEPDIPVFDGDIIHVAESLF